MIEKYGDMFTSDATYLAHGVNCRGIMGAGIAKTIREKFPQVYECYRLDCLNRSEYFRPGSFSVYSENGKNIVNLATQDIPGPNARYIWVFDALYRFSFNARKNDKIERYGNLIAIPEIGCGIGGLEWPVVKKIIEAVEAAVPEIEYEVWHYGV